MDQFVGQIVFDLSYCNPLAYFNGYGGFDICTAVKRQ
jgi:hypothetical protein